MRTHEMRRVGTTTRSDAWSDTRRTYPDPSVTPMTTASHPFTDDRIETVADEHGVDASRLDGTLASVQEELGRDGGGYEYSSEYNYAWKDDQAAYFYGDDDLWEWIEREAAVSAELLKPVRDTHRRAMLDAAADRGEAESVEGMLTDGNEPLVVANTLQGPPAFGQSDSV